MILGIDLRCLPSDGSEGAGIAHAARAITQAILEVAPKDWTIKLYLPRGASMKTATDTATDTDTDTVTLAGSRRSDLIRALRTSPCDLLFVPSGAIPLHLPVPAIPWVHDLDIFDHPEWFPQSWFTRMRTTSMFRRGLVKAPMVFAVSEYTKGQIRSEERGARSEIVVTGEGGDGVLGEIRDEDLEKQKADARDRIAKQFGIKDRFGLILGTIEPRKNISSVVRVWSMETLVIAGRDGWKTESIHRDIDMASQKSHVVCLADVTDDMRRDLLLAASLTLVSSKSEGFGLVALESAQAGTPCLMSNAGALPELFGQGPWLLRVDDAHEWREEINRLFSNESYMQKIASTQRNMSKNWTWKNAAEKIIEGIQNRALGH